MSADAVQKFIDKTGRYGALVIQFKQNPDPLFSSYDLSTQEKEALKKGDIPALVKSGVPKPLAERWARSLNT